jgi:hypothetical protein
MQAGNMVSIISSIPSTRRGIKFEFLALMAQGGGEKQAGGRQKRRRTKNIRVALLVSTIVKSPLCGTIAAVHGRLVFDGSRRKVMVIQRHRGTRWCGLGKPLPEFD